MTTTLLAHFNGEVLVPDGPVELPTGCVLEIRITLRPEGAARAGSLARLAEAATGLESHPDAPQDGAAQHDHYLYGTPKRPSELTTRQASMAASVTR